MKGREVEIDSVKKVSGTHSVVCDVCDRMLLDKDQEVFHCILPNRNCFDICMNCVSNHLQERRDASEALKDGFMSRFRSELYSIENGIIRIIFNYACGPKSLFSQMKSPFVSISTSNQPQSSHSDSIPTNSVQTSESPSNKPQTPYNHSTLTKPFQIFAIISIVFISVTSIFIFKKRNKKKLYRNKKTRHLGNQMGKKGRS